MSKKENETEEIKEKILNYNTNKSNQKEKEFLNSL